MSETIPVGTTAWLWGVGITLVMMTSVTVAVWLSSRWRRGRVKRSAMVLGYTITGGVSAFLLAAMAINRIEIDGATIFIRGGAVYSRSIAGRDLLASSIRTLPPAPLPALSLRTNGIGLPGYGAGWFRDRDSATTFVVYGGGAAVSFRTADDTLHLIGTAQPQRLAAALAAAAQR